MFSLLYRNRIAACLCWMGWLEVYGMIVSVNVGFLYMAVLQFVWVLLMVVFFTFCCEFEFWVYRVEVLKYVLHV